MTTKITADTENAILRLKIEFGKEMQAAMDRQTDTINGTIKEDREANKVLVDAITKRVDEVEAKLDNIIVRFAALTGAIGVVVWIASKMLG